MLRPLAAVLSGFLGMTVWLRLSLIIVGKLLGAEFVVATPTHMATGAWLSLNLPLTFIGAMLGGWLAASIARQKAATAVLALSFLVLVFWLLPAISQALHGPGTSAGDAPTDSAMLQVVQPLWYSFVVPFVGLTGVLSGGTIRSRAAA